MEGAGNSEPRPAASLTGSLLARRGGARPAMRRQPIVTALSAGPHQEDLGWNDMGEEAPASAAEAAPPMATAAPVSAHVTKAEARATPASPIEKQINSLAQRLTTPTRKQAAPASLADTGRKIAFTLRIDPERHLRLRLLSALTNRSAQRLLTEALDGIIAQNEALGLLVDQVESGQGAASGKGKRET